ncbi:hypothetical protein COBT_003415, partial [Conglomerata obtusa]
MYGFLYFLFAYTSKSDKKFSTWNCYLNQYFESLFDHYTRTQLDNVKEFAKDIYLNGMVFFSIPNNQINNSELLFKFFEMLLDKYRIKNSNENFYFCQVKSLNAHKKEYIQTNITQLFHSLYCLSNRKTENILTFEHNPYNKLEYSNALRKFDVDYMIKQVQMGVSIVVFNNCSTTQLHYEFLTHFLLRATQRFYFSKQNIYFLFVLKLPNIKTKKTWLDTFYINNENATHANIHDLKAKMYEYEYQNGQNDDQRETGIKLKIIERCIYKNENTLQYIVEYISSYRDKNIDISASLMQYTDLVPIKIDNRSIIYSKNTTRKIIKEIATTITIQTLFLLYKFIICTVVYDLDNLNENKLKKKLYLGCVTIYGQKSSRDVVYLRCHYIFDLKKKFMNDTTIKKVIQNEKKDKFINFINTVNQLLERQIIFTNKFDIECYYLKRMFQLEDNNQIKFTGSFYANHEDIHKFCLEIYKQIKKIKYNEMTLLCKIYHVTLNLERYKKLAHNKIFLSINCINIIDTMSIDEIEITDIRNFKTIVFSLSYKDKNEIFQYYIVIPIREQMKLRYMLVSTDIIFLQNEIQNICFNLPKDLLDYKIYFKIILEKIFYLHNYIYTLKFMHFDIE